MSAGPAWTTQVGILSDPRRRPNPRYRLRDVLGIAHCAVLSGAEGFLETSCIR